MQILAVDIGTGMQDILLFDTERGPTRMSLPSPTALLARAIQAATRRGDHLYLSGVTMGGGPCAQAVRHHIEAGYRVYAAAQVAHTFADSLDAVRAMGIDIVSESTRPANVVHLQMCDLDLAAIERAFMAIGVPARPDALALAVFDHGVARAAQAGDQPRLAHLHERLAATPTLTGMIHTRADIPADLPRMRAVTLSAPPTLPLIVMEPAFAALLGAWQDPTLQDVRDLAMIHLGNMHTLAVHLVDERIVGLFEHHTEQLTSGRLDALIGALLEGRLSPQDGCADGGHGALVLDATPHQAECLAVTGPKSNLLYGLRYKPHFATPYGDADAAGCWGLIHAYAALHPEASAQIESALSHL
ncbi:MAG: hypothetical protein JW934_21040 [Anaerolineae bacterium]|nr:hypothetical protein [Anaerolineae bacterium]